jgi:hypothetical protein
MLSFYTCEIGKKFIVFPELGIKKLVIKKQTIKLNRTYTVSPHSGILNNLGELFNLNYK